MESSEGHPQDVPKPADPDVLIHAVNLGKRHLLIL
jgi:hypothetical protein